MGDLTGISTVIHRHIVKIAIKTVKDIRSKIESLLDVVAARWYVPFRFDHREEFFGVTVVDLGVQFVMHESVRGNPAAFHDESANGRGDGGEGMFDDAHAADAD